MYSQVPAEECEKRNLFFGLVASGLFFHCMGSSILAPFFPHEAHLKGVNQVTVGLIFGAFDVGEVVGCVLATLIMIRHSSKLAIVAANGLSGSASIMLGLLWYVDAPLVFAAANFMLRVTSGFCRGLLQTIALSMIPVLYEESVSAMSGIIENAIGLGLLLGPLVGSCLYGLGGGGSKLGFVLPFFVLGGIEILFSVVSSTALPTMPAPPEKEAKLFQFSWRVLQPAFTCFFVGVSIGIIDPTLQPHLSHLDNFSVPMVGAACSVICLSFAIFGLLAGALDDFFEGKLAVASNAFGIVMVGLSYALLAPMSIFSNDLSDVNCWAGAVAIGGGAGFAITPLLKQIQNCSMHEEPTDRNAAAAAVLSLSLCFGDFFGPIIAGSCAQTIGIRAAYTYTACACFVLGSLLVVLALCDRRKETEDREKSKVPLLAA